MGQRRMAFCLWRLIKQNSGPLNKQTGSKGGVLNGRRGVKILHNSKGISERYKFFTLGLFKIKILIYTDINIFSLINVHKCECEALCLLVTLLCKNL